ncbi:MAG: adenylate/guanylate cyclase domain-containing protein [Alphaproteobacteria bacterium]|nr:adenylate/guanylate cyclase domain-containing protein [Alphaproteobacteria bacterium]
MEEVLWYVSRIWSSYPGQTLLYGSFLVHYGLSLWALWGRRSLRLRTSEFGQIFLGFAIPMLLARHVVGTRIATDFFEADTVHYTVLLRTYFVNAPSHGYWQMVALVVAWTHAMLGLHFWLRIRPWYARVHATALAVAVLIPVLSLLGMIEAGRQVISLVADPDWARLIFANMKLPSPEAQRTLEAITDGLTWFFGGMVAAVLLARLARRAWQRRHGLVRIGYPDGRFVEVVPGTSVLEASRIGGIPHAHVCGGRGRCSTCRVRVRAEIGSIDPPGPDELRVLRRIGATPNIRLACQLRPRGAVEVTPLLPPFAQAAEGRTRVGLTHGSEREIAILFADIRGFTALAEGRLPYDVVFVLNRYFSAMGRAIETAGGRVDKFIGDGVMALYGIDTGAQAGCRAALASVQQMSQRLAELNVLLEQELDRPLRIGIGIHCGPVIVGEMGYGSAAAITAIGDAVNTASRLEELTKEYSCELVVSEETVRRAGYDLSAFPRHEIELRGKRELLAIRILASARDLSTVQANPLRPVQPGTAAELRVAELESE